MNDCISGKELQEEELNRQVHSASHSNSKVLRGKQMYQALANNEDI